MTTDQRENYRRLVDRAVANGLAVRSLNAYDAERERARLASRKSMRKKRGWKGDLNAPPVYRPKRVLEELSGASERDCAALSTPRTGKLYERVAE